jgi:hypothetical protein
MTCGHVTLETTTRGKSAVSTERSVSAAKGAMSTTPLRGERYGSYYE